MIRREPVRAYLGTLLVALVGLLIGYGVLDEQAAALWLALGTAALAVPAVEITRSKVSPDLTAKPADLTDFEAGLTASEAEQAGKRAGELYKAHVEEGAIQTGGVVQIALGIVLAVVLLWLLSAVF